MCQGDNGMFYRSPLRRLNSNAGYDHFFSRDQAHGVLLAYVCSRDYYDQAYASDSAKRWLNYIDNNRPCLLRKPFSKGCLIRGAYKYAPDDRSDITPTMWAMMKRVWDYNRFPLHSQMKKWEGSDGDISIIEAKNNTGYQLHLKAVQAYIKLLINQSREYSQRVGEIAHSKVPDNLFYEFLATRKVTDTMLEKYLDMRPKHTRFGSSWLWEKEDITQERIDMSCGWDYVFLGLLLLKFYSGR